MSREATDPPAVVNVLDVSSESTAAFQVFLYGRFWVFTEDDYLMLRLDPGFLDQALAAIQLHGYGDFFPDPPELSLVVDKWSDIRAELVQVDLDLYDGYDAIFAFAPKSRLNVRRVALLHPYDLVFYTGLVLALRAGITGARLSPRDNKVFSYHAEGAGNGRLYNDEPGYREFREAISNRIKIHSDSYVGITDIADFYPRIYQHRLINALQAACDTSLRDHVRVLEKMLSRFSENVSYGIPIGPPASRLLGEAILIDVDSTLLSFDIDFMRFTDDYVFFGSTPEDAEYGIYLQATSKTKRLAQDKLVDAILPSGSLSASKSNLIQ